MRDYATVSPKFWIGDTGKKIRAQGCAAQLAALYLMTCSHSNMLGLYYLPKTYLAYETGSSLEGASEALARLSEVGFAHYDEGTEMVWVVEMAAHQIADSLEQSDKRCKGIQKEYDRLPENPFLADFYDKYSPAFNMTEKRGATKGLRRGFKGPTKPRTGTGTGARTRTKQEQEQEQEILRGGLADPPRELSKSSRVWEAYSEAYKRRYQTEPTRNAKVNGQISLFASRVPEAEAPSIAAFYVTHSGHRYVASGHSVGLLLQDAEKLRTEFLTGRKITNGQAREADRLQGAGDSWNNLIAEAENGNVRRLA